MAGDTIEHISDTALWVAVYRAEETARPDAAFRDPLAARLAGERGRAIAATMRNPQVMAFAMLTRTTAIDRLVLEAVARGVDTVINLGAGLDTRPYRMALPTTLNWVEVDLPGMIAYKDEQLAEERPVCALRRIACDLAHEDTRRALFKLLGTESRSALVITEGLVGYLTNDQAERLSQDLHAVPSFQYWVMDYARGRMRKQGRRFLGKILKNVPPRFDVPDALAFFARQGWRVVEDIGILDEADRLGRPFPAYFPWSWLMKLFPGPLRAIGNRTYGYVMFARS